jgi:hypothetical protein
MLRVLICGGRYYTDFERIKATLVELGGKKTIEVVIHGAAGGTDEAGEVIRGADKFGGKAAEELGIPVKPVPADWALYGNIAGTIRNQRMLDEFDPNLVVAFPDPESRGTWDMVRRAKKANIEVRVIK